VSRLIIVRHGETVNNCENRIQGHCDSKLTPKGLRQARRLAHRLRKLKIDKIYTSDLGRAYATTLEVARHHRIAIVRDPRLREIHLGDWEGMTPEEVDKLYDKGYQRWLKKPTACVIPRAESPAKFRKRVTVRVRAIAKANSGKTVLIVTHGGVITALVTDWLGADFDRTLLNLQIDNTSLTIAEDTGKRIRVKALNDTAHLSKREKDDRFATD
jgi:broad specificity phosphatase PhoE